MSLTELVVIGPPSRNTFELPQATTMQRRHTSLCTRVLGVFVCASMGYDSFLPTTRARRDMLRVSWCCNFARSSLQATAPTIRAPAYAR
jgi:hypothetical protein